MVNRFIPLLFCFAIITACKNTPEPIPVMQPATVLKSPLNFLKYRQQYVNLFGDFTAVDSANHIIDRKAFLQQLATGRYLPLRLQSADSQATYQLYPITEATAGEISSIVGDWGKHLFSLNQMEGRPLPAFRFIDVMGKTYTPENTKDKLLVLKCWFTGCVPCVKEMPALNQLVKEYNNRNDVLFVSLAFDDKPVLESFLQSRRFDYAVVPLQKNYVIDTLGITSFPTHLIVNKQGLIAKVVENEKDLAAALRKQL